MTTAVGAALSKDPVAWSIGPRRMEIQIVNAVSGDTGATVTAASLQTVDYCVVCGGPVTLTAQPTYSGAAVTLAFTDPAASRFLQVIMFGK